MQKSWFWRIFGLALVLVMLFALAGCGNKAADDPILDDQDEETDEETDKDYFYPWIAFGTMVLSTGEVIEGLDIFESDIGFIDNYTPDFSFKGDLVWLATESDVLEVDQVSLSFEVFNYYVEESADNFNLEFNILIDDFLENNPASGPGVNSYELDIVENMEGFEVKITRITFGKEQEGELGEPVDYIALEMELRNVK